MTPIPKQPSFWDSGLGSKVDESICKDDDHNEIQKHQTRTTRSEHAELMKLNPYPKAP
jgi:hypothetical protein